MQAFRIGSFLIFLMIMLPACRTTPTPQVADSTTLSGNSRPSPAPSTAASSILTDLATLGANNQCATFRQQPFNTGVCEKLSNSPSSSDPINTGVCRYYCDQHNQCLPPFHDQKEMADAVARIEAKAVTAVNTVRSIAKVSPTVANVLASVTPWIESQVAVWRPTFQNLSLKGTLDTPYTRAACALNTLAVVSNLMNSVDKYQIAKAASRAGDFDEASESELVGKLGCSMLYVLSQCGQQIGLPPPILALAAGGAGACSAVNFVASAIQCQQAKDCCLASIDAGRPIDLGKVLDNGKVERRCCRCMRKTWHDRTWPFKDVLLAEEKWGSVTGETDEKSGECELREGKIFTSVAPDSSGRWTYYTYESCHKETVVNDSCWITAEQ